VKSSHPDQLLPATALVFQVLQSPPFASVTHSCRALFESGATATFRAAAGRLPTSPRKAHHGTQFALELVVTFQVVKSLPCASVTQNSNRPIMELLQPSVHWSKMAERVAQPKLH
jgi:hypothetical protein